MFTQYWFNANLLSFLTYINYKSYIIVNKKIYNVIKETVINVNKPDLKKQIY